MAANSFTGPRNNKKFKSTARGPVEVEYLKGKETPTDHNRESRPKELYTTRSLQSQVLISQILL